MPKFVLGDLAGAIGARLEGDPSVEINGVARLEDAGPQDLSFLANPRYAEAAGRSSAGALIVGPEYEANGQNVLRSDNPRLTLARALNLLAPERRSVEGVHPAAVVDPTTRVPDNVSIGPNAIVGPSVDLGSEVVIGAGAVIEEGVVIGDRSRIFPQVTIHSGTKIGSDCVIQSGTVLGADGFGYATDEAGHHHKVRQLGGLIIGDRVEIGAGVTIDRGSAGDTTIGEGTIIDNIVHIAHNVLIGRNAVIVAQVGIAGSSRIGDHAVLGGQAGLVGHIEVGDRAQVGAQAGVIGDIPADEVYSGYPARSHREQMRAYALFARLPELFQRLKALESQIRKTDG